MATRKQTLASRPAKFHRNYSKHNYLKSITIRDLTQAEKTVSFSFFLICSVNKSKGVACVSHDRFLLDFTFGEFFFGVFLNYSHEPLSLR